MDSKNIRLFALSKICTTSMIGKPVNTYGDETTWYTSGVMKTDNTKTGQWNQEALLAWVKAKKPLLS